MKQAQYKPFDPIKETVHLWGTATLIIRDTCSLVLLMGVVGRGATVIEFVLFVIKNPSCCHKQLYQYPQPAVSESSEPGDRGRQDLISPCVRAMPCTIAPQYLVMCDKTR